MSPEMVIYFLLLLIELICQTAASANRLSDIYWNSTNPIVLATESQSLLGAD